MPKSARETEHLWIVLTYPDADDHAICVNVTTRRARCDETVIIRPGDHPFIVKESVIHYEDARSIDLKLVDELLMRGSGGKFPCVRKESCTHNLLDRIRKGLLDSKLTPKGIKERCRPLWKF